MRNAPALLSLLLVVAYLPQLFLARQANRFFSPAFTGLRLTIAQGAILLVLIAVPHLLPEVGIALLGALLLMGAEASSRLWYISAHGAGQLRQHQTNLIRTSGLGRSILFTAISRSFPAVLGGIILLARDLGLEASWLAFGILMYAVLTTIASAIYYPKWLRQDHSS